MTETKEVRIKICVDGNGNVGKTSLIGKYVFNIFNDSYIKTIGTKVTRKKIDLDYPEKDTKVQMQAMIWDIMGQKAFKNLLHSSYFHGAKGIIGVCNLTERNSLSNLEDWVESAKKITGDVPTLILANKHDLVDDIQMSTDELEDWADILNARYLLTSAKSGENVSEAFLAISREIMKNRFGMG
jgi:small GTP-binding protein